MLKTDTSDMTIDELSEAIDAHIEAMETAKSSKKSAKKPKIMEEKIQATLRKNARVKNYTSKQSTESPKKEARKSDYIVKSRNSSDNQSIVSSEPERPISADRRNLSSTPESLARKKNMKVTRNVPNARMVQDVIIKNDFSSGGTVNKVQKEQRKKTQPVQKAHKEKLVRLPSGQISTRFIASVEGISEIENKDSSVSKGNISARKTSPVESKNKVDTIDELSDQPAEENPIEHRHDRQTELETSDTKYHVPIKPSRQHHAGSLFMVFVVVFVIILSMIYVLNELEIINLTTLFSLN